MSQSDHVLYGSCDHDYVTMTRGDGVYVFDEAGNRYLDAVGGVCVVNIGHGVREVVDAISEQAGKLAYTYGGIVDNEPRRRLAAKLQEWAPPGMGRDAGAVRLRRRGGERGRPEARVPVPRRARQPHEAQGHRQVAVVPRQHRRHAVPQRPNDVAQDVQPHTSRLPAHTRPHTATGVRGGLTYPDCALACANELRRVVSQEGAENIAAFIAEPVIGTSMSAVVPPAEYYGIVPRHLRRERHPVHRRRGDERASAGRARGGPSNTGASRRTLLTSSKGLAGGYAPLGAGHPWREGLAHDSGRVGAGEATARPTVGTRLAALLDSRCSSTSKSTTWSRGPARWATG